MDTTQLILIIAFFLFVLLVTSIIVICFYIHNQRVNIVLNNSELVKRLKELNNLYKSQFVFDIQTEYFNYINCEKKYHFDRISPTDSFYVFVQNNYSYFFQLAFVYMHNHKLFNEYNNKYTNLKSSITEQECKTLKIPFKSFIKIEKKFYKDLFIYPPLDCLINCQISYTSPAGRNHYSKKQSYNLEDLKFIMKKIKSDEEAKEAYEYKKKIERQRLTDSLRYDIMRRDGFKCVLCGASVQEGAKLHVDHIIPIAKGGETKASNLRTLCDRCNLGKRDKIEDQASFKDGQ